MAQQTLNTPRETTHQRIADALEDIVDKIVDTSSAGNIDYDNTESGLDATKVQGAVDELASEKVDKVQGKGLSTNDYTDTEKQKLAGIEAEANKTIVDSAINDRSTNPLQNRVITAALDEKTDVSNFNALTQEFELFNTYDLSNDVEISVFANETYKRDKHDRSYETHIPNLDGEYSVSLGDKTFTETCTFTIANEGKSIIEVFHTNSKYILGAKLLKAENDEVGDAHVIADVVTLLISKDAPYTTTFDPDFEHPPVTGVLTLKVSVKPDEKYVNSINEPAYWGSYNGSDLLINNPILTYSETTFGQPKVSGNPITINDAAEANLVECVAKVEAVQEGSGDPSPDNIRPIIGQTEVVITDNGKTYTIDLDGTRYGGKLDVVSGVLTVDRAYYNISDITFSESGNYYRFLNNSIPFAKSQFSEDGILSHFNYGAYGQCIVGTTPSSGHYIMFYKNKIDDLLSISSVAEFNAYLVSQKTNGNPVQLAYELATPYTIQLTPQQIRLLKGTNNLSCNTGNLTIKYYPDNVLGQLKGDIEGEYDERVETLETQVQPSLIFMSRERRDITSDLSRLSTAVAEQNLPKYGYKIGDYFTGASGYTYILADYNTFKGTVTPYCISTNHIGIVVDTHQTSQWYSGDASSVGYNGSTLHTHLKGTVMDNIKADMIALFGGSTGLEHLIAHSKLFTTALANWAWQANQYISALTCTQIDAGSQWTANGFQEGEASKSLELFRKHKWTEIFESRYPWLRNLSNYSGGSDACYATHYGILDGHFSVAYAGYVVGLIIFY